MKPAGTFTEGYGQDLAVCNTRLQHGLLWLVLIAIFTAPIYLSEHWLGFITIVGISIIAVHGLNILTGYCGQISIGQAAFMGFGGYCAGVLAVKLGLSFWIALPCGGLFGALIGFIFGLPSLRVKGFYLALVTLAVHFIFNFVIIHTKGLTGGIYGLVVPAPTIGSITITGTYSWYYVVMILTVVFTFIAKNLVRTQVGRAFVAIRDNDIAAESMGINIFRYKLLAFATCSFFAGIAGTLWVFSIGIAEIEHFHLLDSIWYLGMLIVGGLGSITGGIFGVIFLKLLNELVAYISPVMANAIPAVEAGVFAALGLLIYGVVIAVFILFEPRGLNHRLNIFKASYRVWPFSY